MNKKMRLMSLLAVLALVLAVGVIAQQKIADTAVDPVCGMTVTKAKAAATFDYKGKTYYFCSNGCKEAFAKEPEKYLAKTTAKEAKGSPAPQAMGGPMHGMAMSGEKTMGQAGCPMMSGQTPMMGHGGRMGMGPGMMAAGVDRLLLRKDVDWTFERTATGVTVKISSKDPETVKAIQERLAAAKERKETMAAPPAATAGSCSRPSPDCPMKDAAKK